MPLVKYFQKSPIIRRILKHIPQPYVQERIDTYRAGLVLKCREICELSETGNPTLEEVRQFTEDVDSMDDDQLQNYVQNSINTQILSMFESINKCEEMYINAGMNASVESIVTRQQAQLHEDLLFSIVVGESSKKRSGNGVFVNSPDGIPPGTVVCLYPGLVHLKDDLRERSYFENLLPDSELMLMTRLDEILIDGRTADSVPSNPYALAHLVNHCGSESKPNVIQISYDFPSAWLMGTGFPQHLRRFIPNSFAKSPGLLGKLVMGPSILMPSVVLIATRHLQHGDELLMDYRLNPNSPVLPAWYQPYDPEEGRNRWTTGPINSST